MLSSTRQPRPARCPDQANCTHTCTRSPSCPVLCQQQRHAEFMPEPAWFDNAALGQAPRHQYTNYSAYQKAAARTGAWYTYCDCITTVAYMHKANPSLCAACKHTQHCVACAGAQSLILPCPLDGPLRPKAGASTVLPSQLPLLLLACVCAAVSGTPLRAPAAAADALAPADA
jgi:hypothetical protein